MPTPHQPIPGPTGALDAADRARLGERQLDGLGAALLNLLAEVASLTERVRSIEATVAGAQTPAPAAVDDLVRRVLAPLTDP